MPHTSTREMTAACPVEVCECGPTVTRDNPGRRCEDSGRGWSRYERPIDAVDLTECAGTQARIGGISPAIIAL
jgi:hypothetical protein